MPAPAPSPHAAAFSKLRAYTNLTVLLPNQDGSILAAGRPSGRTPFPYITVAHAGERWDPQTEHNNTTVRVRIYSGLEVTSFVDIEKISTQVKFALHKANLGDIEGQGFLECRWAGWGSGDLYDFNNEAWYRELRFFIQTGQSFS